MKDYITKEGDLERIVWRDSGKLKNWFYSAPPNTDFSKFTNDTFAVIGGLAGQVGDLIQAQSFQTDNSTATKFWFIKSITEDSKGVFKVELQAR